MRTLARPYKKVCTNQHLCKTNYTTKMRKELLLGCALLGSIGATAQSIDFNFANKQDNEVLEPDFIGWAPAQVKSETKSFDDYGLTITVEATGNADVMRTQWHKNTCTAGKNGQTGLRLLGDGVVAFIADGTDTPNQTTTATSLQLIIKGFEAGTHSVMAYHVWKDPKTGEMPKINVEVNGTMAQQGVEYSNVQSTASDLKMSDASYSYVEFNVAEGDSVIITYSTAPESGVEYQTTCMMLNGIIIDESPYRAADPEPANKNFHYDGDDGIVDFSWTPASVAVSHKLVFTTDSAEAATSTNYVYEGTDAAYQASGLTTSQYYYWRVDEIDAEGNVHTGAVWSFRPRQLAFPEAEGYGRFAQGGRGGIVYHVTSLSGANEPGTLTYGLFSLTGPRYIVFDVSGIIELDFSSYFTKPYATIAGQTAPGKGICIKASNINIGSDVICRHIRFKRGLGVYGENTGNAMGMSGADHAIVDHCTAAWGTDETVSGRGALNISFQYSMIAEALGIAGHKNYADGTNHGYAATIDGQVGSWHHNLLVHCAGRNWSMGGGMAAGNIPIGGLDLFNNVVYNWNSRTTDGNCHAVNFVNNYYKMGADTRKTILFTQDFEDVIGEGGVDQAYISGNIRENKNHSLSTDAKNDTYNATGNIPTTYEYVVSEPLHESYATIHTAKDAMKIVTSYAGATMPTRDEQHTRVVKETLDGTYTYTGSKSGIKGEIDNEEDQGGWEEYPEETRAADWDSDQDGMPDWYEKAIGSDANTANQNDDPNGDGWTLLEDYMEFMAHPYIIIEPETTGTIDVEPFFKGFYGQNGNSVTPTFTIDNTSDLFDASVSGSVITATAKTNAGIGVVNVTVTDSEGSTFTQRVSIAVTGEATGIREISDSQNYTVVKREFFTTDGKKVSKMQTGGVYLMKATDTEGNIHTTKVIKN